MATSTPPSGSTSKPAAFGGGATAGPAPWTRFFLALGLSPRAFQLPFRRADWLIPFLVVLVCTLASTFLLRDLYATNQMDQAKQQIESNQRLSAEQREEAIERLETGAAAQTMRWGPLVGAAFVLPVAAILAALFLMLILNFGMGGHVAFSKLWFLIALSFAPKAVGAVFFTALALARKTIDVSFGPAAFLPADAIAMKTFLKAFDLFEIWVFVLQMIGVAVVTGLPVRKARTGVVILWVIYLVFMLLAGLATGCVSGAGMGARG